MAYVGKDDKTDAAALLMQKPYLTGVSEMKNNQLSNFLNKQGFVAKTGSVEGDLDMPPVLQGFISKAESILDDLDMPPVNAAAAA